MPIESILYLAFVLAAFGQFAAVLAYAEWATRHANDTAPTATRFEHENAANANLARKAA
jgi:hypothetical protein